LNDFRAKAIADKKRQADLERAAQRYRLEPRPYPYIQRPKDATDEQWRALCEARWLILGLTTPEQRRLYLAGVEKHRGKQSRQRLEQDAKELWAKQ
jgi:hypothetical protein